MFGFYRVYEWPGLTTCDINEQTCRPLNGARLTLKVDAPLKAMTGIGVQTVLPGSTGDRFWCKERCFKKNVSSRRLNGCGQPSHDAGHADGAARIGNK